MSRGTNLAKYLDNNNWEERQFKLQLERDERHANKDTAAQAEELKIRQIKKVEAAAQVEELMIRQIKE